MDETVFSPHIEQALRQAGWAPDRQLSAEEMFPWCVLKEGDLPLVIFPAACNVLKELGA